jgi:hypothetical protein
MLTRRQQALCYLALIAWSGWCAYPAWWEGALFALIAGALAIGLVKLPIDHQYRHMLALTMAVTYASWPLWWVGLSAAALYCSLCGCLGWWAGRPLRRGRA